MSHYYLGIDQGTTGTTAIIFNEKFERVARGYCETPRFFPEPGWVEHTDDSLWQGVKTAVAAALKNGQVSPECISAIGLDHEGESVVAWDSESSEALSPVITWQDNRTAAMAEELEQTHGDTFRAITALSPDSYFSATKIAWLLQNNAACKTARAKGTLRIGNLDARLLWKMTGGEFATDPSTASRTMLYDLKAQNWSHELCDILDIPAFVLPPIKDSADYFGTTDPAAFLGIKAPIYCLMCDQQAALIGQGCFEKGTAKTTYGTGCFMLMNTGDAPAASDNGLLTTVAYRLDGKTSYALDGGIYIAGAAVQWLRDGAELIQDASETAALAQSVTDNGGLYFVPAFTGLGAPYRKPEARGIMVGICGGTTRAHIVRATLESIAYQVHDVVSAMQKDSGTVITELRCDGGASKNEFLMQFQADILGLPVLASAEPDATAKGVAMAAALGKGDVSLSHLLALPQHFTRYTPKMHPAERQKLLAGWQDAIARSIG